MNAKASPGMVSILIVNYNTKFLTYNAILAIFKVTKDIQYEVILVDNNSSDGSQHFFATALRDKIRFIQNNTNLGFGKANNLALQEAKGEYVFLLNSDTILVNNAIKILAEYMHQTPWVGVCGPNLFTQEMKPTHSYELDLLSIRNEFVNAFIPGIFRKAFNKQRRDFNYSDTPLEVGYITGASMMIRSSVLDEVGLFDPDFFMYYEETELTARITRANYKIVNIPEAKIIHLEGKSIRVHETKIRMMIASKYQYFIKVWGKKSMTRAFWITQTGYTLRYLLSFNNKYKAWLRINKQEYINARNTEFKK